jgi:hypothetical protein
MSWRPHPRNATSDPHDGPWARCDGCSFQWNLPKLGWQYDYAGFTIRNKYLLKCPYCLDEPQPQLRAIIIPADPDPIFNARPEQYAIDEGLVAAFTASIAPGSNWEFPNVRCIMTVTFVSLGPVPTGGTLAGIGVTAGSTIGDQLSGPNPPGGTGTYAVSPVQTVASTNMTSTGPPMSA